MNCPSCGSDQWKLASVVYDEGAGSTSNTGAGIGASFDGVGVGVGATKGKFLSEFARKASPPVKVGTGPKFTHPALFAMIFFMAIAAIGNVCVGSGGESFSYSPFLTIFFKLIPFLLAVLCMLVFIFTPHYTEDDENRHKEDMKKYKKTKVCLRCGEFYTDNSLN